MIFEKSGNPSWIVCRHLLAIKLEGLFALDEINMESIGAIDSYLQQPCGIGYFHYADPTLGCQTYQSRFESFLNESLEVIGHYFELPTGQLSYYDYFKLLSAIRQIFDDNNVDYFVDELSELRRLIYEDLEYTAAHQYIQKIKQQLYKTSGKTQRRRSQWTIVSKLKNTLEKSLTLSVF